MPLTNQELKIIASLVPSQTFVVLKKIINERVEILKEDNPIKATQFETNIKVGELKGGREELNNLIKQLEGYYKKYVGGK